MQQSHYFSAVFVLRAFLNMITEHLTFLLCYVKMTHFPLRNNSEFRMNKVQDFSVNCSNMEKSKFPTVMVVVYSIHPK